MGFFGNKQLILLIYFHFFKKYSILKHFNIFHFLYHINNFFITIQIKKFTTIQYIYFLLFYTNSFYFISQQLLLTTTQKNTKKKKNSTICTKHHIKNAIQEHSTNRHLVNSTSFAHYVLQPWRTPSKATFYGTCMLLSKHESEMILFFIFYIFNGRFIKEVY
jgi:hypothetical protein